MKATTYINKFKKENGTQDIMKIFMADDLLSNKDSIAAIVCAEPRTTKETLAGKPIKWVVYIYREILDDLSIMHFDDLKKACDYAREIL